MILKPLGTLHSAKNSNLHFLKFPVANEAALFIIFGKEDKLARYTKLYKVFFREFLLHFILIPEFLVVVSGFNNV